MFESSLTPCPNQTQVLYVAADPSKRLWLRTRPNLTAVQTTAYERWVAIGTNGPTSPTLITFCSDQRIRFHSPSWTADPPRYFYYYADDPPDLLDSEALLSFYAPIPYFQFRYPRPAFPTEIYYPGAIALVLEIDAALTSGPDDSREWTVTVDGVPQEPFGIQRIARYLYVIDITYYGKSLTHVTYTPGSQPYLTQDDRPLEAIDADIPYPY